MQTAAIISCVLCVRLAEIVLLRARGKQDTQTDIDRLTSFGDVVIMESGVNDAGNLLIVNEHGAVASPVLPQ